MSFKFRILAASAMIFVLAFAAFSAQAQISNTDAVTNFTSTDCSEIDALTGIAALSIGAGGTATVSGGDCVLTAGVSTTTFAITVDPATAYFAHAGAAIGVNNAGGVTIDLYEDVAGTSPIATELGPSFTVPGNSGSISVVADPEQAGFQNISFVVPAGESISLATFSYTLVNDDECRIVASPNPVPEQQEFRVYTACGPDADGDYFGLQAIISVDGTAGDAAVGTPPVTATAPDWNALDFSQTGFFAPPQEFTYFNSINIVDTFVGGSNGLAQNLNASTPAAGTDYLSGELFTDSTGHQSQKTTR